MHKQAFVMLLAGFTVCASCKDKPAPSIKTVPPSPSSKVAEAGDSCDFPPMRRPVPRFLPGPECANIAPVKDRVILPLEARTQQCKLWCWSASVSALAAYNGRPFAPCEIVGIGTGAACCTMDPCGTPGCDQRLPSAKVTDLLDKFGIVAEHLERPLTEPEMRTEIASGRPVLLVTLNPKGEQHMTVAYGYERGLYVVLDPDPIACGGGGYRYAALLHSASGEWHWTESWRMRSKQPGVCVAP